MRILFQLLRRKSKACCEEILRNESADQLIVHWSDPAAGILLHLGELLVEQLEWRCYLVELGTLTLNSGCSGVHAPWLMGLHVARPSFGDLEVVCVSSRVILDGSREFLNASGSSFSCMPPMVCCSFKKMS